MILTDSYRHKGLRKQLVAELASKGIDDDRVLKAVLKVPRHFFFDEAFLEQAYSDKAFPIGEGQTISQPYTVAYQSQLLQVKPGHKILEIGTGSGYQTCILLELGALVHTVERQALLFDRSAKLLPLMGYRASFNLGDGSFGLPNVAPFDRIIVTAGAPYVPESLIQQLDVGGLLVIPVGSATTQQMVTVLRTSTSSYETFKLDTFRFVPLKGKQAW